MRFLRFEAADGAIIPAVKTTDDQVFNIRGIVSDIGPDTISPNLLAKIEDTGLDTAPVLDASSLKQLPPMALPRNLWCIGLNYSDHAAEAGMDIPDEPILFNKSSSTYCGPYDPILYHPSMTKLDWEVELGIVIGKQTLDVSAEDALDHVFGYVVVNDVSERAWQLERGGQWVKGKSFPNFCPVGPELVTPESIDDVQALDLWLDVNGQQMQSGSTSTMIFDVKTIVSYMSKFCQLEPGDLICTGTPPGVGAGMTPPVWLKPGDEVTLGITGLGAQRQVVTPMRAPSA